MKKPIRVLIADDHAIVRQGLRQILSDTPDLTVSGEAENGVQAVQMVRTGEWDVVLMDVSMPDRNGIDALKLIKKEYPRLPVLILSMYPEEQYAIRALKAGAAGYLCKRSPPDELLKAVNQVAAGQRYIDPEIAAALRRADRPEHPAEALTDKEFNVFLQLAQGRSVAEVAETFHLSPNTVGTHLYHIKQKLGVQNMAELAMAAVRSGLIEV